MANRDLRTVRVELPGPLDIGGSLAGLERWGDDLIDRWDGSRWLRVVRLDDVVATADVFITATGVNDVITVKNPNVSRQLATKRMEISTSRAVPDWLSLSKEEFKGVVMRIPTRDEINPIANEQAVVEFYSR